MGEAAEDGDAHDNVWRCINNVISIGLMIKG